MVNNQVNTAMVSEVGELSLKIGKNSNPLISIKPAKEIHGNGHS
jgi:hypothetical protein